MPISNSKKMIELGVKVSDSKIFEEDKIWSRYSNDKVDIGEELAKVIRTLSKAFPLSKTMRSLSIGSSNEPQFRLLETVFRGGLYLLDIEKEALDIVRERIKRQYTDHVKIILDDYKKIFLDSEDTTRFLKNRLDARRVNLITLHHSLYYSKETLWHTIFNNLYRIILAPTGALHAVLMSCKTNQPYTTSWLYERFAGKFFGYYNEQDLSKFKKELQNNRLFGKAQILFKRSYVRFFVDDFEKFMAVIWMILLYPNVHIYSLKQKEEITEFIYKKFWERKIPLIQSQDHLVIYRGVDFKGLI